MTDTVIHKYLLPFYDRNRDVVDVAVRPGQLLHVAIQDGDIHLWAAVDQTLPLRDVQFRLVGTGGQVDPAWHHLGTLFDGQYVWHIWAEPDSPIRRKGQVS